jgi:hypothetical protein
MRGIRTCAFLIFVAVSLGMPTSLTAARRCPTQDCYGGCTGAHQPPACDLAGDDGTDCDIVCPQYCDCLGLVAECSPCGTGYECTCLE